MQPTSLQRKEKDDDDEDFSDNGDGTGSEVESGDEKVESSDEEVQAALIASIADQQRQLDKTRADLMARKKVAPPAAVTSTTSTSSTTTSSANRLTSKGKGAAETDLNPVRAANSVNLQKRKHLILFCKHWCVFYFEKIEKALAPYDTFHRDS